MTPTYLDLKWKSTTPTDFLDIGYQAVTTLEDKEGRKGWPESLKAASCVDLLKPSIHAQGIQRLALGRLADLAWETGEDKPDTALQLGDEQRLAPKGTSSHLPCQSKQLQRKNKSLL